MKNFIKSLLTLVLMLVLPVFLFAQDGSTLSGDIQSYFVSIAALASLVVIISSWINNLLNLKGFYKQLSSWIIALILSFIGWALQIGMFVGLQWYIVILYGFGVGLVANGIFDISIIQLVLKFLKIEKK